MSVDMHVAPPEPMAPVREGTPHRRRRWVLPGAILLVVALIIASAIYLSHYRPIRIGSAVTSGDYVDDQHVDVDGDLRAYTYHEGGLIFVGVWIENGGPLPITVTGVAQSPGDWEGLISIVAPRLGLDHQPTDLSAAEPFRPFSLSRGDNRLLDVVFQMGHCSKNDPGTSMYVTSVSVNYSVFGTRHSQNLRLPTGVWVTAPARADCLAG